MKNLAEELYDHARSLNSGEDVDCGETILLFYSAANALGRVSCPSGCKSPEGVRCQVCADSGSISVADHLMLDDAAQRHG